jgi:cell division protein FtsB
MQKKSNLYSRFAYSRFTAEAQSTKSIRREKKKKRGFPNYFFLPFFFSSFLQFLLFPLRILCVLCASVVNRLTN